MYLAPTYQYLPAIRLGEATDQIKQRGLAATARPHEGDELTGRYLEGHIFKHDEVPPSIQMKPFDHIAHADRCTHCALLA
ncbi:hypothetical protein PUN4_230008 [Paraburkholderia unamae]|nr:hypothetical protein PUN4_230008 [Paraburkholderia unamae]